MIRQVEPPQTRSRESLEVFVKSFPELVSSYLSEAGVCTPPDRRLHNYVWDWLVQHIPLEGFHGRSVLDVGTNAGFFCVQAKLNRRW